MVDPPSLHKPCCVCDAPGGKHCTKCKSRHYCSKKCQLVDWNEGGHKAQCRQMAAEFQDRLLDTLMPAKLKIKEEPAIVEDVSPAAGSRAAARLSAVRTGDVAGVEATAVNDDASDWRGTCAICYDLLPFGTGATFYDCCGKSIITSCSVKCLQHDDRCPLCRTPASKSVAESLRRLQKHADEGNAEAQVQLGGAYRDGRRGLKQSFKRAVEFFERAAAQGHPLAQAQLGLRYASGQGVKINFKTAVQLFRLAAEQGYREAQFNLGAMLEQGKGVAQSIDEAVRWYRLAAVQGMPDALYTLGGCYANGIGVPEDLDEALRFFKRAAAQGHPDAATQVESLQATPQPPATTDAAT